MLGTHQECMNLEIRGRSHRSVVISKHFPVDSMYLAQGRWLVCINLSDSMESSRYLAVTYNYKHFPHVLLLRFEKSLYPNQIWRMLFVKLPLDRSSAG